MGLLIAFGALGALSVLAAGCGGPSHSELEIDQASTPTDHPREGGLPPEAARPQEAGAAAPSTASQPIVPSPAATHDEARGKVTAIFGDTVKTSTRHSPGFITGDFNGDGAQDIAVIVRPATGALAQINSPVASWILKDVEPPAKREAAANPLPVRVEAADILLAVIHGYGAGGWRDPDARQTYLLRHAVGDTMEPRSLEELMPVPQGRRFTGDVIVQTRDRKRGFIFWTGATYLRHPI